jgi:hypothetical protein
VVVEHLISNKLSGTGLARLGHIWGVGGGFIWFTSNLAECYWIDIE